MLILHETELKGEVGESFQGTFFILLIKAVVVVVHATNGAGVDHCNQSDVTKVLQVKDLHSNILLIKCVKKTNKTTTTTI